MRLRRLKDLNRRVFKRNLKEVLKKEYGDLLKYDSVFEEYVKDYEYHMDINASSGYLEIEGWMTKSGHAEVVSTY